MRRGIEGWVAGWIRSPFDVVMDDVDSDCAGVREGVRDKCSSVLVGLLTSWFVVHGR
jgi:hypothetical protein